MATNANEFGIGLMHEFAITASKANWGLKEISSLAKDENRMKLILGVLNGTHEIRAIEHLIDCDSAPFTPDGWTVEEHQKGGQMKFDLSKTDLYFSKKQKSGTIEGNKLREELKGKKVMNANVLDFLLANPHLIPEEWKGKVIFFWGTIYRDSDGDLYVRYLRWGGDGWDWGSGWLGGGWGSYYPGLVRK